jgi:hypothetical protein
MRPSGRRAVTLVPTRDHVRTRRRVMGQLIDEIITLLALGDTRHPGD